MKDRELVSEFLHNPTSDAFGKLYDAKTPVLYRLALRLTAYHEADAQDLIQEMWLIAIRKLARFRWESELKTWLTSILLNLFRENLRKNVFDSLPDDYESENEVLVEPMYSKDELEDAIKQLPDGYRSVLVLHDVENYRHQEIAIMLNINEGTSKSQLYHARKALRKSLLKMNKTT